MSKVFFDVGISLDGFIAGPNGGPRNPLGDGGLAIHQWMFNLKSFRQHIEWEGGDETHEDNAVVQEIFTRIGANVMGKRMFEEGELNWPENAPFHSNVYVVTHEVREPWVRKGGTTFYFVNDGIESALENAKKAAGNKDVRISGGAKMIQQCLNAGYVDEFDLHLVPLLLGKGVRLFEGIDQDKFLFELIGGNHSNQQVTHLKYRVVKK